MTRCLMKIYALFIVRATTGTSTTVRDLRAERKHLKRISRLARSRTEGCGMTEKEKDSWDWSWLGSCFETVSKTLRTALRIGESLWKKNHHNSSSLFLISASLGYVMQFWLSFKNISSDYWNGMDKLTVPGILSPIYCIRFVRRGCKNSKFYKDCI